MMNLKSRPTITQLPTTSAKYVSESIAGGLFEYVLIGKDLAGRNVYQKYLSGVEYGQPRALLTFREYKKLVLEFAKLSGSIGVQRWTEVQS